MFFYTDTLISPPKESSNSNMSSLNLCLLLTFLLGFPLLYLYTKLWLNPKKLREKLRYQGITGPNPSFFYGNILDMKRIQKEANLQSPEERQSRAYLVGDYTSVLFPYLVSWRKDYGRLFLYWIGTMPVLHISDPDLVKAVSQCTPFELGRPQYIRNARSSLFGEKGILMANAELWSHERKIISQEFFMHRVKGMVNVIVESASTMTDAWSRILQNEGGKAEILVHDHLRAFSGNIISRVSFGNCYGKGEQILSKLIQLRKAISKSNLFTSLPGARFLPTKTNREIHRLNREICSLVRNVVQEHKKQDSSSKDLLHSIIEGSTSIPDRAASIEDFIIDNCKTIYLAAFETTSGTAAWCLLLLSLHPEWQERVREEILEVTRGATPDFDMLRQFKTLTMVIQETLRLFSPAYTLWREALHDLKLHDVYVPKGTVVQVAISMLHRDQDAWGPDADVFNPNRFANGISSATKYPHMYAPFGFGPRICAGQNLAMVELKAVLSLLLMRFSFELSPSYVHSPAYRLTIEPEHDLPLIVKQI